MPGPPESVEDRRQPGDVTTLRDASVLDALQQATSPDRTGAQETGVTR